MSNRPPRATLPGEMYQENGRWWWKVRLPGEPRVRARALKPEGARFAAKSRKVAERVACEMWFLAIRADVEARVQAELKSETEQKIAKAKAKAADAISKAEAECRQKTEAFEKALAEAERRGKVEAGLRIDAERSAKANGEALERVVERVRKETKLRIDAEQRVRMETQARSMAEARLKAETELRAEAEEKAASRIEGEPVPGAVEGMPSGGGSLKRRLGLADVDSSGRTAPCEACGRDGVPEKHLQRIASGQLVCPDCMMLVRT